MELFFTRGDVPKSHRTGSVPLYKAPQSTTYNVQRTTHNVYTCTHTNGTLFYPRKCTAPALCNCKLHTAHVHSAQCSSWFKCTVYSVHVYNCTMRTTHSSRGKGSGLPWSQKPVTFPYLFLANPLSPSLLPVPLYFPILI